MGKEIERRFLVSSDAWRREADAGRVFRQGYFVTRDDLSIRVRCSGDGAWLTLKGRAVGATRSEFEYPVPLADAESMLAEFCPELRIDKRRYLIEAGPHVWEVDVFEGANRGLVIAEVELGAEHEAFERPTWLAAEVTAIPRYLNACLAAHPFTRWSDAERLQVA